MRKLHLLIAIMIGLALLIVFTLFWIKVQGVSKTITSGDFEGFSIGDTKEQVALNLVQLHKIRTIEVLASESVPFGKIDISGLVGPQTGQQGKTSEIGIELQTNDTWTVFGNESYQVDVTTFEFDKNFLKKIVAHSYPFELK